MSSHQLPGLYRLTSILSIYLDFLRWKFNMFFLYISSQPLSVLYRPNSNYQYTLTFFRWKLNVFFCIFIFRGYQLLSGPLHGSSNNMNNGLGAHGTNGSMWNQLFLNLRRQTERCVNSRPGMSINLLTTRWKPKKKKSLRFTPKNMGGMEWEAIRSESTLCAAKRSLKLVCLRSRIPSACGVPTSHGFP